MYDYTSLPLRYDLVGYTQLASNACFASSPELSPNAVDATIIHSLFNIGLFTTATIAVSFTLSSMDKINQSKRK
ncbi:Uncharacterised protein [BD1-7 clade bacterium]|nr:Uncharacterised protein [BD1-7 clade bacterium]